MMRKLIAGAAIALAPLAGVAVAATAHADASSDYLGCLSNHSVTVVNRAVTLDVGSRIQTDVMNGVPDSVIVNNVMYGWNVAPSVAQAEVTCALAAGLMGARSS